MSDSPPTLAYQPSLERDEISIEQTSEGLRVITPPLKRWKKIGNGFKIGLAIIAIPTAAMLIGAISQIVRGRLEALLGLVDYLLIIGGSFVLGSIRLRQAFAIELDASQLKIMRRVAGHIVSNVSYRRDLVGNIHVNPYNGQLAIPIVKHAFVEWMVSDDRAEVQRIADALDAAIKKNSAIDRSLPAIVNNLTTPWTPENQRIALIVMVAAAAVMGLVATVLGGPGAGIGVMLLCLIPTGIVLGTQEKKFWL